jgi:hypothetical protein
MNRSLRTRLDRLEQSAPLDQSWPLIVVCDDQGVILSGPWQGRHVSELRAAWPRDHWQGFGPQVIVDSGD